MPSARRRARVAARAARRSDDRRLPRHARGHATEAARFADVFGGATCRRQASTVWRKRLSCRQIAPSNPWPLALESAPSPAWYRRAGGTAPTARPKSACRAPRTAGRDSSSPSAQRSWRARPARACDPTILTVSEPASASAASRDSEIPPARSSSVAANPRAKSSEPRHFDVRHRHRARTHLRALESYQLGCRKAEAWPDRRAATAVRLANHSAGGAATLPGFMPVTTHCKGGTSEALGASFEQPSAVGPEATKSRPSSCCRACSHESSLPQSSRSGPSTRALGGGRVSAPSRARARRESVVRQSRCSFCNFGVDERMGLGAVAQRAYLSFMP